MVRARTWGAGWRRAGMALGFLLLAVAGGPVAGQPEAATIAVPNGNFEQGTPGELPPQWNGTRAQTGTDAPPPFRAVIDSDRPREGRASVRLESVSEPTAAQPFGTVSTSLDARPYRGRRVRLTAAVRTAAPSAEHIGLWFRVDREHGGQGFFDNMGDRPIRSTEWADYVIEADIATDAERLFIGMLLVGPGKAWMDDVRLEAVGPARTAGLSAVGPRRPRTEPAAGDVPARPLDERGLANLRAFARLYGVVRYFHPSDEAAGADWDALALAGVEQVEGARNPADLAAALNRIFLPVAPTVRIHRTGSRPRAPSAPPAGATAIRWLHVGMGEDPGNIYSSRREPVAAVSPADVVALRLAGGVSVEIPLVVWKGGDDTTLPRASSPVIRADKPAGFVPSGFDRTTRLAAAIAAWNGFEHFYPYFDVVRVDWEAELDRALRSAATDQDDLAFHSTLSRLVAALQDGHGRVLYERPELGLLPIAWDEVEHRLVVTNVGADVRGVTRGDIVTHIDGVPVETALAERARLISGSPQWVGYGARADLLMGPPGQTVTLRKTGEDGRPRDVRLTYLASGPQVTEVRPEPIAELSPGIVYVDLDRVTAEMFEQRIPDLARARGLVFDLRGYPRMPPSFLQHLADGPVRSAVFGVPTYLRPDREGVTFADGGWNLEPLAPRFTPNTVFISNGRAISYAESVLGLVRANRLAEIVGEPSAGTNGNVSLFTVPGGYRLAWTAMRVTNRDGSRHHLVGVRPTVPVSRTLAGVKAGRDEQLERALDIVRRRIDQPATPD